MTGGDENTPVTPANARLTQAAGVKRRNRAQESGCDERAGNPSRQLSVRPDKLARGSGVIRVLRLLVLESNVTEVPGH